MQPMIAESAPHRARWVWLIAGLAAAVTMFAVARPIAVRAAHRGHGIRQIGRCADRPRIHVTPPTVAPVIQVQAVTPSIRVIDSNEHVITVHPRPPSLVGDLLITY